jgi:FKBP-type peptidyl-prolyl cis-trans isomerase SlyD
MLIDDDVWVTVRYRLFDSQGDAIEPSERQLTYLQGGYGAVFPRIEQALEGHGVGYRTSLVLEPEDSFGDYDPELVRLAPREDFPRELEVGMTFEGVPGEEGEDEGEGGGDGEAGMYIVTDFTDEAVVLDGNHPLAGMSLRFEVQVIDVRPASEEEVEQERALAQERGDDDDPEADDDDEPGGSTDDDDGDDPDDGDDGGEPREVRRLH